jgi:hypothetical protein
MVSIIPSSRGLKLVVDFVLPHTRFRADTIGLGGTGPIWQGRGGSCGLNGLSVSHSASFVLCSDLPFDGFVFCS